MRNSKMMKRNWIKSDDIDNNENNFDDDLIDYRKFLLEKDDHWLIISFFPD